MLLDKMLTKMPNPKIMLLLQRLTTKVKELLTSREEPQKNTKIIITKLVSQVMLLVKN